MPGEASHQATLALLELLHRLNVSGLVFPKPQEQKRRLMGLDFPNPVGLAAGMDKNGDYLDALGQLGFGFLEAGTVTPRPQAGNPRPRVFRLPQHQALINRLGFNNKGVDHLVRQVDRSRFKGILGINIGKNAATPMEDAWLDYHYCLERVFPLASYVVVNVSSPNTRGLRDLQRQDDLRRLLGGLRERHEQLAALHACRLPLLVKLAPDLTEKNVETVCRVLMETRMDGVIATNTTIGRPGIGSDPVAKEEGGLSGAPLRSPAERLLRLLVRSLPEDMPVIGVGGILSAQDALDRFTAGADLIQLYTGLVYRGPGLLASICRELGDGR